MYLQEMLTQHCNINENHLIVVLRVKKYGKTLNKFKGKKFISKKSNFFNKTKQNV